MRRTIATRRGLRILQHGIVLSEVLAAPGPTHSIVDVMAAACAAQVRGSRIALLGFEGGGVVAPLRAMGNTHHLAAVDLSNRGYHVFRKLCRAWCGRLTFHQAEACAWLRRHHRPFDGILEDLSISQDGDVRQPDAVWDVLPGLVRRRLDPAGLAVFNLIHPQTLTWEVVIGRVARPFARAHLVMFDEFENRLVLVGNHRLTARELGRGLRRELAKIGSRLAARISVRAANP